MSRMDSREIARAVARKEKKQKEMDMKERSEDLERKQKLESTLSRVLVKSREDGEELTVLPRPMQKYFTNFGLNSYWFVCVCAIVVPIFGGGFATEALKPWIPWWELRAAIGVLASMVLLAIIFVLAVHIKHPKITLQVTDQGHYAIIKGKTSKPVHVGKKEEVAIDVSKPYDKVGWGSFTIKLGENNQSYQFDEIKPKDLGRVLSFRKRHKMGDH
jgi:hypothetical protein